MIFKKINTLEDEEKHDIFGVNTTDIIDNLPKHAKYENEGSPKTAYLCSFWGVLFLAAHKLYAGYNESYAKRCRKLYRAKTIAYFNEFDLDGFVFIKVFFCLTDRQNQAEMI